MVDSQASSDTESRYREVRRLSKAIATKYLAAFHAPGLPLESSPVRIRPVAVRAAFIALSVAACSADPAGPDPGPNLNCGLVQPTALAVGEFRITDPTEGACVIVPSVPAAGASGAEH